MNDKDLEDIAKIEYDCWRENFSPMINATEFLYFQTIDSLKRDLKTKIQDENHYIFIPIRVKKEGIVAFCVLYMGKNKSTNIPRLEIDKFFVSPSYQNNKIATLLLSHIVNQFPNDNIYVKVFENNRIAEHILLKNGFRQINALTYQNIKYGKNTLRVRVKHYIIERSHL